MVTASVILPNGDELLLVFEGGKWRLDAAAVDLYGQATPRQALIGFLRAFERKRYDVILRYVPDAEKEGLSPSEEPLPAPEEPTADATAMPTSTAAPKAAPPPAAKPKAPATGASTEPARLTPDKLRAAWEGPQREQMSRIVQAIRTALPTATIEETGDSASMAYGAGGTVSFVREHGVWKIKDF